MSFVPSIPRSRAARPNSLSFATSIGCPVARFFQWPFFAVSLALRHRRRRVASARGWIYVFLAAAVVAIPSRAAAQTLTNGNVVRMVQAKLSDAVIISEIKHSKCNFDTSANALIKLKQGGVSDTILQAMTEASHAGTSEAYDSISSSASGAIALPENYGLYAVAGGKVLGIDVPTSTMAPEMFQVRVWEVPMMLEGPPSIELRSIPVLPSDVSFVVYGGEGQHMIGGGKVWECPFVGSVPSGPAEAWAFGGLIEDKAPAIQLLTKPMRGQTDAGMLSPAQPLASGVYWIHPLFGQPFLFAVGQPGKIMPSHCFDWTNGVGPCNRVPSQPVVDAVPVPPNPNNHPNGAPESSECSEYEECMRVGVNALQESNPLAAISDFQRAANEDPTNGDPWALLGQTYLRTGQAQDFTRAWDKALRLGSSISVGVWHEQGLHYENGTFKIGFSQVSFANQNGAQVFAAVPSQIKLIKAYRILGQTYFRLGVSGKNYNFFVVPFGVACQVSRVIACPSPGEAQEQIVDTYLVDTIPKLASGGAQSAATCLELIHPPRSSCSPRVRDWFVTDQAIFLRPAPITSGTP